MVTLEIIETSKNDKKPKASVSGEKKAGEKGGKLKKDGKHSVSFEEERVPKKARSEKFCDLCKKHEGAHATHNTGDCKKYEKGVALKKGFKPKGKSGKNENFSQIIKDGFAKVTKAIKKDLKKASKKEKKRKHDSEDL